MKRIVAIILSGLITIIFVSCLGQTEPAPSSETSSGGDVVSDDASSTESIASEDNSSASSDNTASGQEREILKSHEVYGDVKNHGVSGDTIYYLFRNDNATENIFTLCIYDCNTEELTVVDGTNHADGFDVRFLAEGVLLYYDFDELKICFYDYYLKKGGYLPNVNASGGVLFFNATAKNISLQYANGEIYWVETDSSNYKDVLYSYNIESEKCSEVYTSDGKDWINVIYSNEDGLYIKLYPIAILDEEEVNGVDDSDYSWEPDIGDVLFYDGEKITIVVEDIYDFKLNNDGTPLIQKQTYTDEWEEIS